MRTLVSYGIASPAESTTEVVDVCSVDLDSSPTRRSLRDLDQREISDALMKSLLAAARPDEREMLKRGYALALERERTTSAR